MRIAESAGQTTAIDSIFAFISVIIVLEATRRVIGWLLVSIPLALILYSIFGANLPGLLAHRGYDINRVVTYLYKTTEGIFGIPTAVAGTYVIIFIIFAAFLNNFGAGKVFVDLAYSLTRHATGGPAKGAVIASAMLGTISGSATGNVVTTGTFTIPLMKKVGYQPEFAGAVETAASCGGMIMPPVMGTVAFLMTEMTGIPYDKIVVAAAVPAVLYFCSVFTIVDLRTRKKGIGREDAATMGFDPFDWRKSYLFIPLILLIIFLLQRTSPPKAAIQAMLSVIALSFIFEKHRLKEFVLKVGESIVSGVKKTAPVACACFCAGLIVGLISLTGLGTKITDMLLILSGGNLLITLILTAVVSLVLSMGLPTSAVYIIVAIMLSPALIRLGVPLLPAHLFVFYFGMLSSLTPPVALGAYAAAGISGGDPNRTAFTGFKLALAGFIIPFAYVYNPALLTIGHPAMIAVSFFVCLLGVFLLAAFIEGYLLTTCRIWERGLLLVASISLFWFGAVQIVCGLLLTAVVLFSQFKSKQALQAAESS